MTPLEFRALLDPLLAPLGVQGKGALAVAVSGGGDSMALLLLANAAYPGRVQALTVDHGLRAESAHEALLVSRWCAARGIEHRVLAWQGAKPTTAVQARARSARYQLLAQAAAELGPLAAPLLVAHTIEDQAETFLLRLAHKSDLAGLAAMRAASEIPGAPPVPLLRPLLTVSRAALRSVLRQADQEWIEDPSNNNRRFERVRLRNAMPHLDTAGLTTPLLARTSRLMEGVARLSNRPAVGGVDLAPDGSAAIDAARLEQLPSEIGLRLLSRVLRIVGGEVYPPGREALSTLLSALKTVGAKGATLGGCRISRLRTSWLFTRELRAASRSVATFREGTAFWDNRFWIRVPDRDTAGLTVVAAGRKDAVDCGESVETARPPRRVRYANETLPAIRRGDSAILNLRAVSLKEWTCAREPAALFVGRERLDGELTRRWQEAHPFLGIELAARQRVS